MHYVYVLKSIRDNGLYVGQTSNIDRRLDEHDKGEVESTVDRRPLELVYYSAFKDRKKAIHFESYLKSGSGKAFLMKRLV